MNPSRVPKASPDPLPELITFLEPFAPLFRRKTSRASLERYVTGLLTDLPHETCETINVVASQSPGSTRANPGILRFTMND
jgi:hypothetical protein